MKNRRYLYPIVFAIHIIIALIAFKDFRLDPSGITYSNTGDGLKNHFTLLSYVKEPAGSEGIFKYNVMNYPFGEYVFYTDNTPAFAIPFKWFCHHVYDLSDYTLEIFQSTLILGILISGLLCFYVFRRLLRHDRLAFVLAVILPWTNIQVMRIWRGHFNLSYSFLLLLALALCIKWQETKDAPRKRLPVLLASILLGFSCFFIHGYYLPIVVGFQASVFLFYGIARRKTRDGKQSLGAAVVLPVASVLLVTVMLLAADGFYKQRSASASGYNMEDNKVHFGSLLTSYDFYTSLSFPVKELKWGWDPENQAFLGNCGLYALLFILVLIAADKKQRARFRQLQRDFFRTPLLMAVALAGLVMLFISVGETYTTSPDGFTFTNIFNPFLYLRMVTQRVEQFRCLGRFAWPLFFSFYVWVMYTLAGMIKAYPVKSQWTVIVVFTMIGALEIKDYADKFQAEDKENTLARKHSPDFSRLKLQYGRYQAFVPIPFFMVGSEATDYVIDDVDSVSLTAYQFHLQSHLPMMACKMSRTVPEQSHMMLTLFANDSLLPALSARLNNKPVLICCNRRIAADSGRWAIPRFDRPKAREYYFKIAGFPQRHGLTPVDSAGDLFFYEWTPKP